MPATVDRDIFLKNLNASKNKQEESSEGNFETQQAIKVAHCAVSSLKVSNIHIFNTKDISNRHLQLLLKDSL